MEEVPEIVLGIDLGTTNSCVSIWENDKVIVIPNKNGAFTTPSMVSFSKKDITVGDVAKNNIHKNYENTIYGVKRLIGRNFNDKEVQEDIKYFPFTTEKDKETGKPTFKVLYKQKTTNFFPEDISGFVLEEMKKIAKSYLNKEITEAVITVPAYFNDLQRKATQAAALKAGLNVRRMINEPTAAALAYGLDKKLKNNQNVLVFDLGGGTFDVTVLNVSETLLDVKSTRGDMHLGGDDFDNELVQYCLNNLKEQGKDYSNNKKVLIQLKIECEKAKINLSNQYETTIFMDHIGLNVTILRAEFEDLCQKYFTKINEILGIALEDANLTKEKINEIVLVGGSTRIPKIQEILKEYFGKVTYKYENTILDVDKIVSMGAAIQGAIIEGVEEGGLEKILLDVTPFTLGVELRDGSMDPLIKRNTKIPTEKTQPYKAVGNNVKVNIYQGEDKIAKNNQLLGSINIEPGIVKINFFIDLNGVLSVSVVDKKGNEKQLTIDLSYYLAQ
jgi:L1 cell adhesion molecule like protein